MSSTVQREPVPTSLQIVERVADAKGVAPDELSPLYKTIDTDALDTLFQSETASREDGGHVQFQYEGYAITVYREGHIELG